MARAVLRVAKCYPDGPHHVQLIAVAMDSECLCKIMGSLCWALTKDKSEYLLHLLEVTEISHNFHNTLHTEFSVNLCDLIFLDRHLPRAVKTPLNRHLWERLPVYRIVSAVH